MGKKEAKWEDFEKKAAIERLRMRGLRSTFPPLESFLRKGIRVLDVGCGPGSITLDVAVEINPGSIVGIDRAASAIKQAQTESETRNATNTLFQVSEAEPLPFEDDSFDLTYSHSLLEYLKDPVSALSEQKRVTKTGGTVVAGIGIYEMITYPQCRASKEVREAYKRLRSEDLSEEVPYFNWDWGYQAPLLMAEAGFVDIIFEGYVAPIDFAFQGSEYFDYNYGKLKLGIESSGVFSKAVTAYSERANVTPGMLSKVREEIINWQAHPSAFFLRPEVVVGGRVQ